MFIIEGLYVMAVKKSSEHPIHSVPDPQRYETISQAGGIQL